MLLNLYNSFAANNTKKAEIAVEYGCAKKVLRADRALEKRFPASLTKVMTLYLLFKAISEKKVSFNTRFKVSKFAVRQPPSKLGLKVGEKIMVSDLIKAMVVKSANDAAVVVAEGLCGSVSKFCLLMNRMAIKLGMVKTHFENPSGLPDARQITCAKDIAVLGMALYRDFPQYWHFLSLKSFKYRNQTHMTHCKILKWYKGTDGGKTGFTNASGYNLLVTAEKFNKFGRSKRVFVVVFGGNTSKTRDLCAAHLLNSCLKDYNICSTSKAKDVLHTVRKHKSLSRQIEKADKSTLEETIFELDSVAVSEILKSNEVDQYQLDKLYENEEGVVQIIEEGIVFHKK
ncbi:MAG: D-alanyl-D-alanine carboxypeptidase [Holosporales bacterium]|nr:D-alanyl-D-alanine carboxypeptidase [Holosporales bacterium]